MYTYPIFIVAGCYIQWLDSSNKFTDSLHMPVCTTTGDQTHTLIVKGEDGGYFLLRSRSVRSTSSFRSRRIATIGDTAFPLRMEQLAAGVYHLQVIQDKEVQVLKIIKK